MLVRPGFIGRPGRVWTNAGIVVDRQHLGVGRRVDDVLELGRELEIGRTQLLGWETSVFGPERGHVVAFSQQFFTKRRVPALALRTGPRTRL